MYSKILTWVHMLNLDCNLQEGTQNNSPQLIMHVQLSKHLQVERSLYYTQCHHNNIANEGYANTLTQKPGDALASDRLHVDMRQKQTSQWREQCISGTSHPTPQGVLTPCQQLGSSKVCYNFASTSEYLCDYEMQLMHHDMP